MNKSVVTIVVVVVLVLAGGIAYLTMNKSNSTPTTNTGTGKTQTTNTTNPSAANSVTIENFAFSPASITVKKGTTVTWTNKDSIAHTVTKDEGQSDGPDSGSLAQGTTYSFTFTSAGTFNYHCTPHPNMTGTVTVTE